MLTSQPRDGFGRVGVMAEESKKGQFGRFPNSAAS